MSSSIFPLLQVQLIRYIMPAIIILGDIGNIFVIILFSRRRQNSCSTFLLWAAVLNSIAITFNMIFLLYNLNYGDPTIGSPIFCKFRSYFSQIFSQTARYLTVLACFDRFLLTSNRGHIFRFINRPLITRRLILILFIFWCIFLTHIFILTTISNGRCGQFGLNYIFFFVYLMLFVCILPSVLMAEFGYLAHRNMIRLHARVQPVGHNSNGTVIIHRRDRELLIMIVAEVVVYIVTMIPYPIITLEVALADFLGVSKSIERLQIENFFSTLALILIYLNCSASFYTYIIVSKPFRQDFKELFTKCTCRPEEPMETTANQRTIRMQSQK